MFNFPSKLYLLWQPIKLVVCVENSRRGKRVVKFRAGKLQKSLSFAHLGKHTPAFPYHVECFPDPVTTWCLTKLKAPICLRGTARYIDFFNALAFILECSINNFKKRVAPNNTKWDFRVKKSIIDLELCRIRFQI